jgi:glyceraldehyde 3-phosphate dehydrogenase
LKTKIAINGFGRIGRNLFRLLIDHPQIEVVAINDIADNKTMAHLIKYDSIHGVLRYDCSFDEKSIIVNGKSYLFFHEKNRQPRLAIARYRRCRRSDGQVQNFRPNQRAHFIGSKKVILSAPSETEQIKTVVLGVNEHILDGSEKIISNASCTTNNAAQ